MSLFLFSPGLGSCEHPQGQEEQEEAAAAIGGEKGISGNLRNGAIFKLIFVLQPPPSSYSSFSLHNMAASTVASSEATAATSLPPAVRVRLYELFVQVR